MRIVTKEELLTMKDGIVFTKYEPCYFGELRVFRGRVQEDDFGFDILVGNVEVSEDVDCMDGIRILQEAENDSSISFSFDLEGTARYGWSKKDMFAVYEKKDIEQLIERLQIALKVSA